MKTQVDINGTITISRPNYSDGSELIIIQINDRDAVERFIEVKIGYAEFAKLLTGLGEVSCKFDVRNLHHVGKIRETASIKFPIKNVGCEHRKEIAIEEAKKYTPDGWECANYFGSHSSFLNIDDNMFACTMIKRWIDKDD